MEEDRKPEVEKRDADEEDVEQDNHEEEEDGERKGKRKRPDRLMPRKADFRMRAHINPLSDSNYPYPITPDHVDWSLHYPAFFGKDPTTMMPVNTAEHPATYPLCTDPALNGTSGPCPEIADIGCGFGGLLVGLSPLFPDKLMVGMEIRGKVVNYVGQRIRALRIENPGQYNNASVIRTNSMKFIAHYFRKGQLSKIFFCFPDPHFKASNHRRRIVTTTLVSEYAYLLRPGGRLYTITDVEELHLWMAGHCEAHPLMRRLTQEELDQDPCIPVMTNKTEEGIKVERARGLKLVAVFERLPNPDA